MFFDVTTVSRRCTLAEISAEYVVAVGHSLGSYVHEIVVKMISWEVELALLSDC